MLKKLTSDILDTFLASRRQGMPNHTLLFYQRCRSKAIGIELSPQGISSFLANLRCGNGKHAYYRVVIVAFAERSSSCYLLLVNPPHHSTTSISWTTPILSQTDAQPASGNMLPGIYSFPT